jgi:hypothetical protein
LLFCSCGKQIRVDLRPGDPLSVQAAAVFPFEFRWEEPAFRSYELSQMLVLQLMATHRYSVFGPGEFKLVQASSHDPFVGSDLVLSLADHGLSPMQAIVFRPSAERRSQSGVQQVFDSKGNIQGVARVEEVTLIVRLDVFHSASRQRIASSSATLELDPFATRDMSDPMPELTRLMRQMMASMLVELSDRAPGHRFARSPGFEYLWNPKASFEFKLEDKPPFSETLAELDPLDQEMAIDARLRFFLPLMEETTLAMLKRLPPGLLVTETGAAARSGLNKDDLIVRIDGEAALPQVLQRALRTPEPRGPLALEVRRGSETIHLALAVSESD